MKCFTPSEKDPAASIKIPSDGLARLRAVQTPKHSSHHLAVRTHVHAGGPRCGNQCVAYRKCLGDNDEWAAINCDM